MHLPVRFRVPLAGIAFCSVALLVSACGGGSSSPSTSSSSSTGSTSAKVPAADAAVVGSETVAKSQITSLIATACLQYKAAKKACPKKMLAQSYAAQLVQQAEFVVAGKQLKVGVDPATVTSDLQKVKLQYAKGTNGKVDEIKWQSVLKANHTTEAAVISNIKNEVLQQAIYDKLTKNVKVTAQQIKTYYTQNKKLYSTPAHREVRHILVKTKALADKIYAQLAGSDAQFAALAKKYTIDPGSKKTGGKLGSIQKGQTPPQFDKVAFSIKTGVVSKPVHSSYGWHIIEATGATVPATVKPLNAKLMKTIRGTLLTSKKQNVANTWFTDFQKKLEKDVHYAAYYAPAKTTSTPASTASTAGTAQTTTTG